MILSKKSLLLILISGVIFTSCQTGDNARFPDVFLDVKTIDEVPRYVKIGSDEPYTGTQTYTYIKSDTVASIQKFKDGIRTEAKFFNNDGSFSSHYAYGYLKDELVHRTRFYESGQKQEEWIEPIATENNIGITRMWFENGKLKFEMFLDGNKEYHGIMTKWDEAGNVIAQEKYEHGKQVKI